MRKSLNQIGSSHIVIFLGIAVIAAVGMVGYRVMSSRTDSTATTKPAIVLNQTANSADIKSTADVKQAGQSLDSTNVDSSVNPNQLDSDLNSVL